jgi:lauroyl/myristoyl acyltransferase
MLDRDLARIYGVSTTRLNEQVKRNIGRFPADFMFQLTKKETTNWVSQNAIPNSWAKMGLRIPPRVFTEHGAVMLAAVLNSPAAVSASVQIVRAFNRLRRALAHRNLALALTELAERVSGHDRQFRVVFEAIRELMEPPEEPRGKIGFTPPS